MARSLRRNRRLRGGPRSPPLSSPRDVRRAELFPLPGAPRACPWRRELLRQIQPRPKWRLPPSAPQVRALRSRIATPPHAPQEHVGGVQ
eukprot:scaffold3607_cov114-Isochrysis_galbana.AAC.7